MRWLLISILTLALGLAIWFATARDSEPAALSLPYPPAPERGAAPAALRASTHEEHALEPLPARESLTELPVVSGRVKNREDFQPVAGAAVSVWLEGEGLEERLGDATSAEDGSWSLEAARLADPALAGSQAVVSVRVHAKDFVDLETTAGAKSRLEWWASCGMTPLGPAQDDGWTGRVVLAGGEPVAAADVVAWWQDGDAVRTTTHPNGEFRYAARDEQVLVAIAARHEELGVTLVQLEETATEGRRLEDLVLVRGEDISGVVLYPDDRPARHVSLRARTTWSAGAPIRSGLPSRVSVELSTRSDDQGRFTFRNVPAVPAAYSIHVTEPRSRTRPTGRGRRFLTDALHGARPGTHDHVLKPDWHRLIVEADREMAPAKIRIGEHEVTLRQDEDRARIAVEVHPGEEISIAVEDYEALRPRGPVIVPEFPYETVVELEWHP